MPEILKTRKTTVDTSQQNQSKPPAENSGGGSSGGGGQGGSGSGAPADLKPNLEIQAVPEAIREIPEVIPATRATQEAIPAASQGRFWQHGRRELPEKILRKRLLRWLTVINARHNPCIKRLKRSS